MSKFLLNLLLQISKALIYSKIKLLFGKDFFPHFRPNRPSGQPAHPVFRPSCDHFFFNRPLPLSPLGLGLSAGPAGHALVAPCSIAASLMGKHLTSHCLHPSPCPADRWAPIVITFLRLRPSLAVTPPHLATSVHHSTPRDAAPVPLPPPPHHHHQSPPLTPHYVASPSTALRPLPPTVSTPPLAAPLLSAPIKGRGAPPAITTLTAALLCSLQSSPPPPHRAPTATAAVSLRRLATSLPPEPR
jgi:hypothetical protein